MKPNRMKRLLLVTLAVTCCAAPLLAQRSSQTYGSLFNPDFRVEGNIVGGFTDDPERFNEESNRFSISEAGVALRSFVDPTLQFDLEISGGEGLEGETRRGEFGVEQAYVTVLRNSWGFWARIGKMPSSFGEYNDEDPDEAPQVTPPDVILNYFGDDDGYIDTGINTNINVPIGNTSHIFWLGVFNGDNPVLFHDGAERKPVYQARYEGFLEIASLTGFELGISYLQGLNRRKQTVDLDGTAQEFAVRGETKMWNVHVEFNWQPERSYLYEGLEVVAEYYLQEREYFDNDNLTAAAIAAGLDPGGIETEETTEGFYVLAEYQFARNWGVAARIDRSPVLLAEFGEEEETGAAGGAGGEGGEEQAGPYTIYGDEPVEAGSLILSYFPSRFSTWRIQATHKRIEDESWNEVWVQLQVLIGFERPDVF